MRSLQWHLKTHWSSQVGFSLAPGTTVPGDEGGFVLVDGAGPYSQGGSIWDTCSGSIPVLRHVSVWVGRTPPQSLRFRGVVGAEFASHQSFRNEGDVSGIAVISGGGRRSSCDRYVRQLDGCGLRQQAGQNGVLFPLLVGRQSPSEVDRKSRRQPRCEVTTKAVQCSGQSPQPSGSGYRDRVVSPLTGGESSASLLGLTVDQPVRGESQCETSPVLFLCPGSPGSLRGCVSPSLGQPGPLRVSALSSSQKGGGSSQRDIQSLHDSGRPPLARERVVRRPSTSADSTTSRAALVGPAVAAAPLQPVPPRRPCVEPLCVATLQHLLRKSGFSRGSAIEMSGRVRTSTSRLYQAKWVLFCGWCHGRGVAPVNSTVPPGLWISLSTYFVTRVCPSQQLRAIVQPLTRSML